MTNTLGLGEPSVPGSESVPSLLDFTPAVFQLLYEPKRQTGL